MTAVVESLRNIHEWSKLTISEIEGYAEELTACVGKGFEWLGVVTTSRQVSIATFGHQQTNMVFHLIPGGADLLGLSDDEFEAVKQLPYANDELLNALRPAEEIEVGPFLMSRLPLLEETVTQVIDLDWSLFRPDFQPLSGDKTGKVPIYLTRSEVTATLGSFGFSLLTEAQWEYAVRAGTDTPFYFGTTIPDDQVLESMFNTDFRVSTRGSANAFGIEGMLVGSWCSDSFRTQRWHGTDLGPPYVIRGGAAIYWPWQSTGEWLLALSAMRRSSAELEDQTCSAHVTGTVRI